MKKLLMIVALMSFAAQAEQKVIHFPKTGPEPVAQHVTVKQCTMRLAYGKNPIKLTRKGAENIEVIVTDIGEQFNVATQTASITSGFMQASPVKGVTTSINPEYIGFVRTPTEYIFSSNGFQEWYYINNCHEVK